jgi:hypothetical protein
VAVVAWHEEAAGANFGATGEASLLFACPSIHHQRRCQMSSEPDLGAVFDEHVACEFVEKDVAATMRTMTAEPYVWHGPVLTGAAGRRGGATVLFLAVHRQAAGGCDAPPDRATSWRVRRLGSARVPRARGDQFVCGGWAPGPRGIGVDGPGSVQYRSRDLP